MGQVLQFRMPERQQLEAEVEVEPLDIDLMTAVDVALRDLADIIPYIALPAAREQAEACQRMLQNCFNAALAEG